MGGLTIAAASEKIRKALISKYSSLGGSNPNTSVSVTLGQIRTILVNVMGEVRTAGTYRLSSFSSVFHALYRAGGVTPRGSSARSVSSAAARMSLPSTSMKT